MNFNSNLAVHFSSEKQDWATPQKFFDEMNAKYGPFDLDVCATEENKKCDIYYSPDISGLTHPWAGMVDSHFIPKCWMNPPYGRGLGDWIKKAYDESQKGCFVVALLPARTDTRYFHEYIYNKPGVTIEFLRGRLKFGDAKNSAPFPSMIVVFNPPKEFVERFGGGGRDLLGEP